jgi:hypothetical protein
VLGTAKPDMWTKCDKKLTPKDNALIVVSRAVRRK